MHIVGAELFERWQTSGEGELKAVINARGAIFFPADQQHRDQSAVGLKYDDDSQGNALAAMLHPGEIEIRFDRNFSDAAVLAIIEQLARQPGLAALAAWRVKYQGRTLRG
jgi:hypothetical protein